MIVLSLNSRYHTWFSFWIIWFIVFCRVTSYLWRLLYKLILLEHGFLFWTLIDLNFIYFLLYIFFIWCNIFINDSNLLNFLISNYKNQILFKHYLFILLILVLLCKLKGSRFYMGLVLLRIKSFLSMVFLTINDSSNLTRSYTREYFSSYF